MDYLTKIDGIIAQLESAPMPGRPEHERLVLVGTLCAKAAQVQASMRIAQELEQISSTLVSMTDNAPLQVSNR